MPAFPRPRSSTRIDIKGASSEQETPSYQKPTSMAKTKSFLPPYAIPTAVIGLLGLAWLGGLFPSSPSEDPNSIVFISIGDYGVGKITQKEVAAQMAVTAKWSGARFILSLGDNVYDKGVTTENDPLFYDVFEDIYTQPSLQKKWLMTLGDHDHRGSVSAQIAFTQKSKKWHMPAPYYLTSFQAGKDTSEFSVDIIITDSVALEALVASEDPAERRFAEEYNMTAVGKKAGKKEMKWLKKTLEQSQADWKLVVGHRPVLTCAVRPRYPAEANFPGLLQPLLEQYHVDAYLSGHDHVGQHLEDNGVSYYGNGVGGYGNHDAVANNATVWMDPTYAGFILHKITRDSMVSEFIDKSGKVLHTATINHKPKEVPTTSSRRLMR